MSRRGQRIEEHFPASLDWAGALPDHPVLGPASHAAARARLQRRLAPYMDGCPEALRVFDIDARYDITARETYMAVVSNLCLYAPEALQRLIRERCRPGTLTELVIRDHRSTCTGELSEIPAWLELEIEMTYGPRTTHPAAPGCR